MSGELQTGKGTFPWCVKKRVSISDGFTFAAGLSTLVITAEADWMKAVGK